MDRVPLHVEGVNRGVKMVQVKEFMLPGQHKLGKHRPAKPFGRDESASLFHRNRFLLFRIGQKREKTAQQREQELCWPGKKDRKKNAGDKRWMKSRKKDLDFIYQFPS